MIVYLNGILLLTLLKPNKMPVKLNEQRDIGSGLRATALWEITDMINYYRESTDMKCPNGYDADAECCWVSIKELFALITDNPGVNGIRIYYGRHRESTASKDNPVDYIGRHNIILVPTLDTTNPANPTVENSDDMVNDDKNNGLVNSASYSAKGLDGVPPIPPVGTGKRLVSTKS